MHTKEMDYPPATDQNALDAQPCVGQQECVGRLVRRGGPQARGDITALVRAATAAMTIDYTSIGPRAMAREDRDLRRDGQGKDHDDRKEEERNKEVGHIAR